MAVMLFTWGFSVQAGNAAEEYSNFVSTLLPEPGYLIAQEQSSPPAVSSEPTPPAPAQTVSEPSVVAPMPATPSEPGRIVEQKFAEPIKETCRVNGEERPGPCSNYQAKEEFNNKEEMNNNDEEREQFEQERQKQELGRWKKDRLNETKNFIKEIDKVRKQFLRLKGSTDYIAKLDSMKQTVAEFAAKINATTDSDDLRGLLEDTDFGDWWQELDNLRAAVEIPRDLNNIRKDQKRIQATLKQKWVCKLIDCNGLMPVIQNMGAQLEEATRLYQAGEYEDARGVIQETFHERGWFGDAMGAVQMMRGFLEPLKQIRDKDLKAEMEELVQPVKDLLYEGEVREARESMEVIQKEMGPSMFKLIMNAQKKKQAVPEKVLDKIEQLRQKFEQQVNEELMKVPVEKTETAPAQPVQ